MSRKLKWAFGGIIVANLSGYLLFNYDGIIGDFKFVIHSILTILGAMFYGVPIDNDVIDKENAP